MFFCAFVYLYYILVVRAASIDGCLCLSGSLSLLSCMLVLILCFEANKYDDDDDRMTVDQADLPQTCNDLRVLMASRRHC